MHRRSVGEGGQLSSYRFCTLWILNSLNVMPILKVSEKSHQKVLLICCYSAAPKSNCSFCRGCCPSMNSKYSASLCPFWRVEVLEKTICAHGLTPQALCQESGTVPACELFGFYREALVPRRLTQHEIVQTQERVSDVARSKRQQSLWQTSSHINAHRPTSFFSKAAYGSLV